MVEYFRNLLDTSDFMPRWDCGTWSDFHGWLHICSDLGIWSAYVAIPIVLVYFAAKRRNLVFRSVFLLFGAFILACGTTHLMEAIIFWQPHYRLAGLIKFFTALISWATVLALVQVLPRAFALRSPEELEREIGERRQVEAALQKVRDELELRVESRTAELAELNQGLRREVDERKRAETAARLTAASLEVSEARIRAILESALDCIISMDHAGRIIEFNPAATQTFGYTRNEALMQPLGDLIVPASARQLHETGLRTYMESGLGPVLGQRIETTALRKGGEEFPVELAVTAIREGNEPVFTAYLRDLTQRKQAEKALHESQEETRKLALIAKRTDNAVILTDASGYIEWVNEGFTRITEFSLEEARGKKPGELVQGPLSDPKIVQYMRERTSSGQGFRAEVVNYSKSRRIYWIAIEVQPIYDDAGKLRHFMAIESDITQRVTNERELSERAQLSALSGDIGVALAHDFDLRSMLQRCTEALVQRLNATLARIWTLNGASDTLELQASAGNANGIIGSYSQVPINHLKIGSIARQRQAYVTNDIASDEQFREQTWANSEGVVAFAGYPLICGDLLLGVMAVFSRRPFSEAVGNALTTQADSIAIGIDRFFSARAMTIAKEEAEAANRAKSEFLSRMSHELRTPLNAILGFAQLLEMDPLNEEQIDSVRQIHRGGKHLLGLINEVLDIARIEAGSMDVSPEPVCVNDIIREVVQLTRTLGDQRNVKLIEFVDDQPKCHVLADYQKLKQVLLNLVSNGIKYNYSGGIVQVSFETFDGHAKMSVEDNGPGISESDLDRIFVPFDRLGAERSGIEGSGLGLTLSSRLVELMGGKLSVRSEPGKGTTFHFTLPRVDRISAQLETPLAATMSPGEEGPSRTVLYIEDNLDNIRLVERVFSHRPNLQLLTAIQGRIGLELAELHHLDAILLDVHLPDLQGEEVLRRLKTSTKTHHVPVVMLSADATTKQIDRMLAAGASDYLTKPLDVQRLLAFVDSLSEGSSEHA